MHQVHMSPAINENVEILCFNHSDQIEMHERKNVDVLPGITTYGNNSPIRLRPQSSCQWQA